MTTKWRNAGAPFTLSSGTTVGTGQVFEAEPFHPDVRMRRRKLHPVAPDTETSAGRGPLYGVDFGSDVAYELARGKLTAADFEGREGSGEDGAFLASDVREMLTDG